MLLKALLKAFLRVIVVVIVAATTGAFVVLANYWAATGTLMGMFYQSSNILIFLMNDENPYLSRKWWWCGFYLVGINVAMFLAGAALLSGYILPWLALLLLTGYLLAKLLKTMRKKWDGHFTFRT